MTIRLLNLKRRSDEIPQREGTLGAFTAGQREPVAPPPFHAPPPPAPPPSGPQPPALSQFNQYKVDTNKWRNIIYGPAVWSEGGNDLNQDLDLDLPETVKPVAGYPVVLWFHANGSTKTIPDTGTLATVKAECLAAGFAFIAVEFRHPVVNVTLGAPHVDTGLAIQYARAMANAFGLDKNNFFGLARSRGSLCLWQALQADRAQANALTWEERQSSLLKGVWTHAAQTTYSTTEFANLFIVAGAQRTAFLTAYPDDSRWGSALQSVPTAPSVPHLHISHVDAYPVGLVNANQVNEHYSGFGAAMRDVYIANGHTAKVTAVPSVPDANAWIGAAAWFTSKLS